MTQKPIILPVVKTVVVRQGLALLLRRAPSDPYAPGIWEFPGGTMEFGEDFTDTLLREVAEETGLRVKPGPLLYTAAPVLSPVRQAVVLNYLSFAGAGEVRLSHEHDGCHWAGLEEMRGMLGEVIRRNMEENDVFTALAPYVNHRALTKD